MVSHLQTVGPGKAAMQFENLRADGHFQAMSEVLQTKSTQVSAG